MFKIYGGATEFNQWEQGKLLTNEHMVAGDRVLFRSGSGEAIPVQTKKQDDTVVVDVPNELLMCNANIVVDLVGRPTCRTIFKVNAAERPADYEFVQNIVPPTDEPTGGSGGGGVSSWNDLTDKPFGESVTELYSVENGTFPIMMGQMPMYTIPDPIPFVNGQTYTVIWDGVSYDCVFAGTGNHEGMMGNMMLMDGEDTGEPFVYISSPSSGVYGFVDIAALMSGNLTETTHSFSVIGVEIKKLDFKYQHNSDFDATETEDGWMKNMPFGRKLVDTVTFDGNIEGKEMMLIKEYDGSSWYNKAYYCKISDSVPAYIDEHSANKFAHELTIGKYSEEVGDVYNDKLEMHSMLPYGDQQWFGAADSDFNVDDKYAFTLPYFVFVRTQVNMFGMTLTKGTYALVIMLDDTIVEFPTKIDIYDVKQIPRIYLQDMVPHFFYMRPVGGSNFALSRLRVTNSGVDVIHDFDYGK